MEALGSYQNYQLPGDLERLPYTNTEDFLVKDLNPRKKYAAKKKPRRVPRQHSIESPTRDGSEDKDGFSGTHNYEG